MVQVSLGDPVLLGDSILHVRISDSRSSNVEAEHKLGELTVSHGAFRNDGSSGYHSPALAAIKETSEEWLFFDWWNGSWADSSFRFQIQAQIQENPQMNGALFDEAITGNGSFAFAAADSGFAYDYYGNIPSCMLIRRGAFFAVLEHLHTLFPYPIQKLADAARKNGLRIEKIHASTPKQPSSQDFLMVPAGRQAVLRGKNWEKKKLLVITHELSWTGAPLVLAEACIAVLKPAGYEILVLSQKAGPVSAKYLDNGIPVMTLPDVASENCSLLNTLVQPYDAVIVNTIVPFAAIQLLNTLNKPILWWIHECELIYQWVGHFLPQKLGSHIYVCCVGQYALDILKRNRPDYSAQLLIYGLQDTNPAKKMKQRPDGRRLRFATIGSIGRIKGQDILVQAIDLLRDHIRSKCEFLFVGKTEDSEILAAVETAQNRWPEYVRYIGPVARDVLDEIYPDLDCVICPSRCDCMPTFVAEGMMYGKPAICSENTGMAPILCAGAAGFVYSDNDPCKLAEAITEYVSLSKEEQEAYSTKARICFEKNFALDVFRKNLLQVMEEVRSYATERDE